MNSFDQWIRWCFNLFIFLLCLQLGILLFLRNAFHQEEQKLKDSIPEVAFSCGTFDSEDSYWQFPAGMDMESCDHKECPDSIWFNKKTKDQEGELHVITDVGPQVIRTLNGRKTFWRNVDVTVTKRDKPQTIVLVSTSPLLAWNFKIAEGAEIKEVVLVSPEVVWKKDLPEGIPFRYFPREKICSYPSGWEEIANGENQFRRLFMALKEYTGLEITSFQGKEVARFFAVPPIETPAKKKRLRSTASIDRLSLGIHWKRDKRTLRAGTFKYRKNGAYKEVEVPEKTQDAVYDRTTRQVYLIKNYRFGRWDWQSQRFLPISIPLLLPEIHWPIAMTLDTKRRRIVVYNDERGGELYAYNIEQNSWQILAQGVGYTYGALAYNRHQDKLLATKIMGNRITEFAQMDANGKMLKKSKIESPLDFSRSKWKIELVADPFETWLKITNPSHPDGDIYPMSQVKMSL